MATVSDVPLGLIFVFAGLAVVGGIIAFMSSHLKNQAVRRWLDAVVALCKAVPATPVEVAPRQEMLMTMIERVKRLDRPDLSPGSPLVTSRMLSAEIPRQMAEVGPLFDELWAGVWNFYCSGGLDPTPIVGVYSTAKKLFQRLNQMRFNL